MVPDSVALGLAVASVVVTAGWFEFLARREARRRHEASCEAQQGHRWVYHSAYRQGRLWNRVCGFCGRHEVRWTDTPHKNWPPPGAMIRRGDSRPDEEWRERVARVES